MKLLNIIEATKVQEGSNDSYYAYHNAAEKWAKDTGQPKEKFAYAGVDVQDKYIEPEMKKYGLVPDSYQGKGVTKYRRENTEEGFPDYKMMTRGHDHNDKTCPVCKGSGNEKSYDELNNKPGHVYIQKPKPKCPSCDGTGKKIEEGEERSIIADACVEKLVDEFSGRENQFENKEDFEYAIYQALEDLDVEDCVDPDMEVGGQRIGDFASGRVIDCCSSSSIIYDVMANMDETQIGEGIFDKHSYDPVAPGGQSSKRKNLHATGDIVSLDGKEYVVTKVDLDKGTVDVVDRDGKRSPNVKAGVFSPGIKVGDKKSPTIGNFASDNRDPRLFDGKSPHKKGSAKYKKHMAAMHAESEEEGRWAIYIDGKDSQVRFKDYVDAGEMEDKMKKKHPEKDIVCKKVGMSEEIADPRKSDADQIIQQIIDGYGIDNLEDVFRQYYPQLSDEQVERFISKYKKPELKLVKTEDVDLNDDMIGEPDDFYDAEERTEAHKDLQNALQGNYMDDYIIDGYCPACGGSGYMDGEETFTNDDGEEEESSECDGFGNYGCDEGEMTYGSDGPSWVEIIKHDESNAQRQKSRDEYPGDEKVISQIANMVRGMDDPRMAMQQMAIDYPHMGRAQRASLVAKGMKAAGLTNEGQRCWKGYEKKGTKKMFGKTVNNCVKKEGAEMNEQLKIEKIKSPSTGEEIKYTVLNGEPFDVNGAPLEYGPYWDIMTADGHSDIEINSNMWPAYEKRYAGVKGYNPVHPMKKEGRIEDTFGTKTIDKHDKPEKKKAKKEESIQVGDELMIETAEGEGIVVPVLHVVGENILVGWDQLAEDIFTEQDTQLAELRKLAGLEEAEYQGRKVKLGKPTRGDVKKFKVYVKDPKTGNVKKVNFGHGGSSAKKAGQKTMKIKKSNPARRKSFRARHNCDNPGPRTKARYWSCRKW